MKKFKTSKILLLALGIVLIAAGAMGAFAVTASGLPFESDDYTATFYMNHLQIHLLENGKDVCDGQNTINGSAKITGQLAKDLGASGKTLGKADPGRVYKEEIAARNGQNVPVYVRMTVRKYWVKANADGTEGDKTPDLSPSQIHLTYGADDYNSTNWFINPEESTSESATYYYRHQLDSSADTEPLFSRLMIDGSLLSDKYMTAEESKDESTGVTTITYTYTYDGYAFIIKADVQAIQTHNANDAIHSQWGVTNVTESDGTLSLS